MAYMRQILHLVHLTCFSFILGNMINEYFLGKMKLEKEQYPILGKLYSYAWLGMIVSGIWQIMVISKQHNYVKGKKYMTWVKLLFVKTILGLVAAYGLEIIANVFTFLFLFIYSGIIREFRETQLVKKDKKKNIENKKNE